jgi:hypothetical protein
MDQPLPERFYKYTTASTAKAILKSRAMRWSRPALLNDPYDIQFDLHLEIDRDKLRKLVLEKIRHVLTTNDPYVPVKGNMMGELLPIARKVLKNLPEEEFKKMADAAVGGVDDLEASLPKYHAELRGYAETSKVLCMSEVGDSLLMWAYYAEQHRGVVLRFRAIKELDSMFLAAKPVHYAKDMPRLFDEEFMSDLLVGKAMTSADQIANKTIYTKAVEWAHEKEWRLNAGSGWKPTEPYEDVNFFKPELDGVIFGCATPPATIEEISAMARAMYPDAELLRATKHDRQFRLVLTKIP